MKNLTTPKEVFTYIRDEYLSEENMFICCCVLDIALYKEELYDECMELFAKFKPKNDSFTKYKYWEGCHSWWNIDNAEFNNDLPALLDEKRRFLTHLISKL